MEKPKPAPVQGRSVSKGDVLIIVLCILGIALCAYQLLYEGGFGESSGRELAGTITNISNDIRLRSPSSLVWRDLDKPRKIYFDDMIYSGKDSTAILELEDGSKIELAPETLIVVRRQGEKLALNLKFGDFKVAQAGSKLDPKPAVPASDDQEGYERPSITLLSPMDSQTVIVPPAREVRLRWKAESVNDPIIELANNPKFAGSKKIKSEYQHFSRLTIAPEELGKELYWRVLDNKSGLQSETRKFKPQFLSSPRPLSPLTGQTIPLTGPNDQTVVLKWADMVGVKKYQVEFEGPPGSASTWTTTLTSQTVPVIIPKKELELDKPTSARWRVQAVLSKTALSDFSEWQNFNVTKNPQSILLSSGSPDELPILPDRKNGMVIYNCPTPIQLKWEVLIKNPQFEVHWKKPGVPPSPAETNRALTSGFEGKFCPPLPGKWKYQISTKLPSGKRIESNEIERNFMMPAPSLRRMPDFTRLTPTSKVPTHTIETLNLPVDVQIETLRSANQTGFIPPPETQRTSAPQGAVALNDGEYLLRMRYINVFGEVSSPYSEPQKMKVMTQEPVIAKATPTPTPTPVPPPTPTPLPKGPEIPVNEDLGTFLLTGNTEMGFLEAKWKPLPNVAEYQLEVAYDQAFQWVIFSKTTSALSTPIRADLTKPIYWRVRARFKNGNVTEWSNASTIQKKRIPAGNRKPRK